MSLENVVRQCAPTLANIKTGSLFPVPYTSKEVIQKEIQELNKIIYPKGLCLIPLRYTDKHICLLYMFRPERLSDDLSNIEAQEILYQNGYKEISTSKCIHHLIERLENYAEFPHEIGLFLSYPVSDVIGFIDNHAKNCKFSGLWKVYGDEQLAKDLFVKYQKCTSIYCANYHSGISFEKIAVASK